MNQPLGDERMQLAVSVAAVSGADAQGAVVLGEIYERASALLCRDEREACENLIDSLRRTQSVAAQLAVILASKGQN